MRKIVGYILIVLLLTPLLGVSQSFYAVRRDRKITLNFGTGASRYFGELVSDGSIGKVKMNINAGAEYQVLPRIGIRADVTWFQLSGSDALADLSRRGRNLSFVSNNFEVDLGGSVQLFPDDKNYTKRRAYNFYGVLGVGLLRFNPKAEYQGEMVALQPLQTEGVSYSRLQFVVPMGLGVKLKINPWTNVAIEGIYRETFTDYLDDISSFYYVDPATLPGGVSGLSAKLADRRGEYNPDGNYTFNPANPGRRGNPDSEDSYFILTAKIQVYIPTSFGQNRKLYSTKRKGYKSKGGMFKVKKNSLRRR